MRWCGGGSLEALRWLCRRGERVPAGEVRRRRAVSSRAPVHQRKGVRPDPCGWPGLRMRCHQGAPLEPTADSLVSGT